MDNNEEAAMLEETKSEREERLTYEREQRQIIERERHYTAYQARLDSARAYAKDAQISARVPEHVAAMVKAHQAWLTDVFEHRATQTDALIDLIKHGNRLRIDARADGHLPGQ